MTQHCTDLLSDYLDDELTLPERAAVESHLASCAECTRTLAELRAVVDTARTLPPRPPAADLWEGIAAKMAEPPQSFRHDQMIRRRVMLTLPQIAAAAMLLIAVSAWVAIRFAAPRSQSASPSAIETPSPNRPDAVAATGRGTGVDAGATEAIRLNDAQFDRAVAELRQAVERGRGRLDPATIAIIEQDLQTIDEAVDEARRALDADPANGYLTGHLAETRQVKLDLLRRAAALVDDQM